MHNLKSSTVTLKNIFLFLLSFFLISYLAKLGDFFSFSSLITPSIFLALVSIFFFLKKEKIKINVFDIFLIFTVFYSLFSVFFNEITSEHFMLLMQFNVLSVGSYFILRFIAIDNHDMKILFRFISIIFLCSLFFIYLFFPAGALIGQGFRLGGNYFNPVGLGYSSLMVLGSSLCGLLYVGEKKVLWKIILIFSFISALIIIFLSGSRGPFGTVAIVLMLLFLRKYFKLSVLKKISILLILIASVIYFFNDIELGSFRALDFSINRSVLERLSLYEKAFNAISEAPLLGNGFSEFQYINGYPHNIILELVLYFGVVGLLFSYLIIVSLVYMPIRIIFEKNDTKVLFFTIILLMLIPKFASTNLGMTKELLIFLSIFFTNKNRFFHKE
jgi:O-antigen ligase